MRNYPDSLCTYGYMTICDSCLVQAPRHVNTSQPIDNPGLPIVACELCDKLQQGDRRDHSYKRPVARNAQQRHTTG